MCASLARLTLADVSLLNWLASRPCRRQLAFLVDVNAFAKGARQTYSCTAIGLFFADFSFSSALRSYWQTGPISTKSTLER